MLNFLKGRAKRRKLRLFACAMCRLSVHLLVGLDGEGLLREAAEAADVGGNKRTIRLPNETLKEYAASHSINARGRQAQQGEVEASHLLQACRDTVDNQTEWHAAWHNAMFASRPFAWTDPDSKTWCAVEEVTAARDFFGNPFRKPTFSRSWRSNTVLAPAKQMYEARDFNAMPVLANALEDAGCVNDDIFAHCRDTQAAHVRGCWVDLVLGSGSRIVVTQPFWENAGGGSDAGSTGIACQDERNVAPWHNRGAICSTTFPVGIGKDFVRGTGDYPIEHLASG